MGVETDKQSRVKPLAEYFSRCFLTHIHTNLLQRGKTSFKTYQTGCKDLAQPQLPQLRWKAGGGILPFYVAFSLQWFFSLLPLLFQAELINT